MDVLLTLLGSAGCNFVMGIPGSDDIMLNYQSTSFHDALYVRRVLGLRPAPQFEDWLRATQIFTQDAQATLAPAVPARFQAALRRLH
jgi:ethanolamine ammonia-lyase large subunit